MEWEARINYLRAKDEVRRIELYTSDLICQLAKVHYEGSFPMPSDVWYKTQKVDRRSAEQIINDVLNKLGGE